MTRLPLMVAADHPAFAGHFPARPIVPGVVLLDQSLRAIASYRDALAVGDGPSSTVRIGVAKFLSVVAPGEALRLEIEPGARGDGRGDGDHRGDHYSLRVIAGPADAERTAVTAMVTYETSGVAARDPGKAR